MGHTNFNMLLKYVPPLVITLALNLEPVLGSLFGWAVGVAALPGPWTAVGGVAMLLATMVVSSAAAAREQVHFWP
jgi:drug/metabolite transporter (DMT)-like permease